MKKTKILYWIFTGLFVAFMIFSSIPDILLTEDAIKIMHHLGYPDYITVFIGVAKILGCIAILVPGFLRTKEWAYAGLFIDLVGATYSMLMADGPQAGTLFMLLPFSLGIASYLFYHKKLKEEFQPLTHTHL